MNAIANAKEVTDFCYTQLTDIEQEKMVSTITTVPLSWICSELKYL